VFNPGFFSSTKLLLRSIGQERFQNKRFLELGAGSGLLSIYAAQNGASVVASDINPIALGTIESNAEQNCVEIETVYSNVFDRIEPQVFDFIVINPPYYKRNPATIKDYAWFCGENGEFFEDLFASLNAYTNDDSLVLMVLCDGCDIPMIKELANENRLSMRCVYSDKTVIEMNYVFKIERTT